MTRAHTLLAAPVAILALAAAGCGGSSSSSGSGSKSTPGGDVSPAGDIPDNQAFVAYAPPGGGYSVKVPEGWGRSRAGGATTFSDKLNSIRLETAPAKAPLTVAEARRKEVPALAKTVRGFSAGGVTQVKRSAGPAVKITYLAQAKADPVTGKATREAVERYVFFHKGRDVVVTLSGPKGADNVDPWRTVTDSVRYTR
jgi:hypothetical protein